MPSLAFDEVDNFAKYGRAFMWAMCVTTGMGFDIDPQTDVQNWMTIGAVIGGIFMCAPTVESHVVRRAASYPATIKNSFEALLTGTL